MEKVKDKKTQGHAFQENSRTNFIQFSMIKGLFKREMVILERSN